MGWNPGLYKEEKLNWAWAFSAVYCLSAAAMWSCFKLLLPWFPCYVGLYPQTVIPKEALSLTSCFCWDILLQQQKKTLGFLQGKHNSNKLENGQKSNMCMSDILKNVNQWSIKNSSTFFTLELVTFGQAVLDQLVKKICGWFCIHCIHTLNTER